METINGTKNPLLKVLKEGDVVMVEVASSERSSFKQICRLHSLKYLPADDKFDFDWLDFETDIMYTNYRLHPKMNKCVGNCLAINEIIPTELIELYVKQHEMWKPEMYQLSDVEYLAKSRGIDSLIRNI